VKRIRRAAALAAATAVLVSGCGQSSDEEPAGDEGASEAASPESSSGDADEGGFDPASAMIPSDLPCSRIDKEVVADALRMPVAKVKVVIERKVGDKYSLPMSTTKQKSLNNLCQLGTTKVAMVVTAHPDVDLATQEQLTKGTIKSARWKLPKGAYGTRCKAEESSQLGPAGALTLCVFDSGSTHQRLVSITGLLGAGDGGRGTRVACQLQSVTKSDSVDQLRQRLEPACTELFARLAEG
jgi:hypothetical protein